MDKTKEQIIDEMALSVSCSPNNDMRPRQVLEKLWDIAYYRGYNDSFMDSEYPDTLVRYDEDTKWLRYM